jgi:dihydropteroate synthase
MQHREFTAYGGDVVGTVAAELAARVEAALRAGIAPERLVVDPGLGFSKTAEQNWELVAHVDRFEQLGHPVLVGASRKTFLGHLLASPADGGGSRLRPVGEREHAHAALVVHLAERGVWCLRVHDVRATRDALAVVAALREAGKLKAGAR